MTRLAKQINIAVFWYESILHTSSDSLLEMYWLDSIEEFDNAYDGRVYWDI